MDLHNLRNQLAEALRVSGLSQIEFATKHGLSYSWINKFLNGKADNPRHNSLEDLQRAITAELQRPRNPSGELQAARACG